MFYSSNIRRKYHIQSKNKDLYNFFFFNCTDFNNILLQKLRFTHARARARARAHTHTHTHTHTKCFIRSVQKFLPRRGPLL